MQLEMSDQIDCVSPPWQAALRSALRRLPGMLVVWGAIGAAVGVMTAPTPGPIGIVAGVIAGLVVIAPLGAVLTFAGGRPRESLVGAGLGLALVPGLARFGDLPVAPVPLLPFGLVFGAIVGASAVTALYRLPRLVFSAGRSRPTGSNSP